MGSLSEYKRKTPLFDGKPKQRIWMVELKFALGPSYPMALFTGEERAEAYADRFPKGRARVSRWLTDTADERLIGREFMKSFGEEE